MFKSILVPTNLDEVDTPAIRSAIDLALHHQAQVSVVHVIELIQDTPFEELKDFYDSLYKKAEQKILLIANRFRESHIPCSWEILYGDRVSSIVDFADEKHCDLILLQSHRIEPEKPGRGWGTISYKISILSDCPVLLVK